VGCGVVIVAACVWVMVCVGNTVCGYYCGGCGRLDWTGYAV
jgi:hypothetical protein